MKWYPLYELTILGRWNRESIQYWSFAAFCLHLWFKSEHIKRIWAIITKKTGILAKMSRGQKLLWKFHRPYSYEEIDEIFNDLEFLNPAIVEKVTVKVMLMTRLFWWLSNSVPLKIVGDSTINNLENPSRTSL